MYHGKPPTSSAAATATTRLFKKETEGIGIEVVEIIEVEKIQIVLGTILRFGFSPVN
ncbi:MAG: hypothetical protein MK236_08575 [Pedosphaera sp.]|nr:hypothetical protein [Pedosphaera sp.]